MFCKAFTAKVFIGGDMCDRLNNNSSKCFRLFIFINTHPLSLGAERDDPQHLILICPTQMSIKHRKSTAGWIRNRTGSVADRRHDRQSQHIDPKNNT